MNTTITKTTKPANRPEGFTKADWETKTFRVYNGLLRLDKGEIIFTQFSNHPIVKELMEKCCECKTPEDRQKMSLILFEDMCKFCTRDHQKVNNVKTISSLRKFFNGEWKELKNRPVTYKEPKAPKTPAKKSDATTTAKDNKVVSKDEYEKAKKTIAQYYKAKRNQKSA